MQSSNRPAKVKKTLKEAKGSKTLSEQKPLCKEVFAHVRTLKANGRPT